MRERRLRQSVPRASLFAMDAAFSFIPCGLRRLANFLVGDVGSLNFGLEEKARSIFPAFGVGFWAHDFYLIRYIIIEERFISYRTR